MTVVDAASLDANVTLGDFTLDASGFTSANDLGGGTLELALTAGSDLVVRFTPVPEPSAIGGLALALGTAGFRRRTRRKP